MLIEDSALIEFAIGQLKTLSSECKLTVAMFNTEPIRTTEDTDIAGTFKNVAEQQHMMKEYEKRMEYFNGKFEAYVAILKELGVDTNNTNK